MHMLKETFQMLLRRALISSLALLPALAPSLLHARVSVLNGLTHEQIAAPGDSYEGDVVLANPAATPAQVRLYQTDYRFDAAGTAAYDEIGSLERSNGRWVTLGSPGVVTLEPQQRLTLPFTVDVPATPGLNGTYWSLLMVEEVPPAALAADVQSRPHLGVRNVYRYAIQIITHIGESGEEDFRVSAMKLEAQDPDHLGKLEVDLENVGDTMLRAELRFELFDQDGRAAGVFLSSRKRLFPMTSGRFTADLTTVPSGVYKLLMLVRLTSGSVYASEYVLQPSTTGPLRPERDT